MKRVVKAEEIGHHKTRDSCSAIDGHYADMSQVVLDDSPGSLMLESPLKPTVADFHGLSLHGCNIPTITCATGVLHPLPAGGGGGSGGSGQNGPKATSSGRNANNDTSLI